MSGRGLLEIVVFVCATTAVARAEGPSGPWAEIPAEVLQDKIHGGLLGQLLGNLNGLPHEMKYIDEPGDVDEYTPALPEGAVP